MPDRPQDHPAYQAIAAYTAHDPVPCAGCTACCRGSQVVELREMFGDDIASYPFTHVEWLGDHMGVVLDRQPNGDCIHLGPNGCTIYDRRPLVCRGFDCRRNWLSFTTAQRAAAIHQRLFPPGVFEAGEKRLPTLRLLPGEEELWEGSLGERVIAKRERA